MKITRRRFIRYIVTVCGAYSFLNYFTKGINSKKGRKTSIFSQTGATPSRGSGGLREGMFYEKKEDDSVGCLLCPHRCILEDNMSGICRARENRGGKLYSLVYGKPCTVQTAPIEAAPFNHFIPGHRRLTVATPGCNFRCKHCHNWQISQAEPGSVRQYSLTPEEIISRAKEEGVRSISFTYTEPVVSFEYIYDICRLCSDEGIKTSIVSNGFINRDPMEKLLPVLDAVKIDLKAFTEDFYREVSSGHLEPVLSTLKLLVEKEAYFEIVNLIIPTLNDSQEEIEKMCDWIYENLGGNVPVHFTRFTPSYKLTGISSTPVDALEMAREKALEKGIKYVYIGNVPGHRAGSTYCPQCGEMLIHRVGFSVRKNKVSKGHCSFCNLKIPGIWENNY